MEPLLIRCPFCFETFEVFVDTGGGETQELISDCEVCCHPIDIVAQWDEEAQKYHGRVERGSGF